jgi:hypothetical protein
MIGRVLQIGLNGEGYRIASTKEHTVRLLQPPHDIAATDMVRDAPPHSKF